MNRELIDAVNALHQTAKQSKDMLVQLFYVAQRIEAAATAPREQGPQFIAVVPAAQIAGSDATRRQSAVRWFKNRGITPNSFDGRLGFSLAEWPGILERVRAADRLARKSA